MLCYTRLSEPAGPLDKCLQSSMHASTTCKRVLHRTRTTEGTAKAECLTFQNSREVATLAQVVCRQRDIVGHCPTCPQQDHSCDYCCWMSHPAKAQNHEAEVDGAVLACTPNSEPDK